MQYELSECLKTGRKPAREHHVGGDGVRRISLSQDSAWPLKRANGQTWAQAKGQ